MRYKLSELLTLPVVGKFETGETVTIKIYDSASGDEIATDDDSCTEIGATGFYLWSFANLTEQPSVFKRLLWVMSDGVTEQSDIVDAGGWAESIPTPIGSADTCKVTVNLSDADGNITFPNDLFTDTLENSIELRALFYGNSRYYRLGKYKPSFDGLTGVAFWVLPQGATVDIVLESYGVEEKSKVVPASDTIDLYAWINA